MNERVTVDAFDGRGGGQGLRTRNPEEFCAFNDEERTETFTAAEHGVTQGGDKFLRGSAGLFAVEDGD